MFHGVVYYWIIVGDVMVEDADDGVVVMDVVVVTIITIVIIVCKCVFVCVCV